MYHWAQRTNNQFEPVHQIRLRMLRANCPNIYTVPMLIQVGPRMCSIWTKFTFELLDRFVSMNSLHMSSDEVCKIMSCQQSKIPCLFTYNLDICTLGDTKFFRLQGMRVL